MPTTVIKCGPSSVPANGESSSLPRLPRPCRLSSPLTDCFSRAALLLRQSRLPMLSSVSWKTLAPADSSRFFLDSLAHPPFFDKAKTHSAVATFPRQLKLVLRSFSLSRARARRRRSCSGPILAAAVACYQRCCVALPHFPNLRARVARSPLACSLRARTVARAPVSLHQDSQVRLPSSAQLALGSWRLRLKFF